MRAELLPPERVAEIEKWLSGPVRDEDVIEEFNSTSMPRKWREWLAGLAMWLVMDWIVDAVHLASRRKAIHFPRLFLGDPHYARLSRLRDWLADGRAHGWELWSYSTDAESWDQLAGECGYAFVETGELRDFHMWINN